MVSRLLHGHARFLVDHDHATGELLRKLVSLEQNPDAVFVGCSDSRVVPEVLTSSAPGRIFVVRNVANVVPSFQGKDSSVGAALEYAIGVLKVPHLVVCGHYGCGGVKAALDGNIDHAATPSLGEWLAEVRPAVEGARGENDAARWRSAVERNVLNSLNGVATYEVAKRALDAGTLELHGWVYDFESLALEVYDATAESFLSSTEVLERSTPSAAGSAT